jgi:hypothetical protein
MCYSNKPNLLLILAASPNYPAFLRTAADENDPELPSFEAEVVYPDFFGLIR